MNYRTLMLIGTIRLLPLFSREDLPFITGELLGQTGNMCFQIATTCAVAWDNGAEAYFPQLAIKTADFKHLFFRFNVTPPSDDVSVVAGEGPSIPFQNHMKLAGYFQAERYFAHHRNKLLKLFSPSDRDLKIIKKRYQWILDHPNTVGVQLRYYRNEVIDGYPQYGLRFLEKAMAQFPSDTLFVISSDNIRFAKNNVPSWATNVYFLERESPHIDFFILSLCKHNIISNSSFGWWAAWLNQNQEKKVICPANWTAYASEELFPKDWIRIDAEPEDL